MSEALGSAPLLVIITGLPGTGKTTLGMRLAARLRLPLLHKDGIKEILFDTLGWSDRAWSRSLGMATYELIFHLLAMELAAGRSLIVEANFDPAYHSSRFLALQETYRYTAIQVLCWSDGATLVERSAPAPPRPPGIQVMSNWRTWKR